MTKAKSTIVTVVAGALLAGVLYLTWAHDIHSYRLFITIFAYYGVVEALIVLYKWLRMPSVEPKHQDFEVASGSTIPKSWLNPFKTVEEAKKSESTANDRTA